MRVEKKLCLLTLLLAADLRAGNVDDRVPEQVRQPIPVQISAHDDDKISVDLLLTEFVQETRTRTATFDGQLRAETYTVAKPVTKLVRHNLSSKSLRWYDAKGTALEASQALIRVRQGNPVFVSADGASVNPYFLDFLSDDAIVVVAPPAAIAAPQFSFAQKCCPKQILAKVVGDQVVLRYLDNDNERTKSLNLATVTPFLGDGKPMSIEQLKSKFASERYIKFIDVGDEPMTQYRIGLDSSIAFIVHQRSLAKPATQKTDAPPPANVVPSPTPKPKTATSSKIAPPTSSAAKAPSMAEVPESAKLTGLASAAPTTANGSATGSRGVVAAEGSAAVPKSMTPTKSTNPTLQVPPVSSNPKSNAKIPTPPPRMASPFIKGGPNAESPFGSIDEHEIVRLANLERAKESAGPLVANEKLFRAARMHSEHMARLDQIGHELEGDTPEARIAKVEYAHSAFAENCAAGQNAPAETIQSWLDSPGHRTNMLNPAYREVGIGIATSASGQKYFTMVLGTPSQ